jgi:hypothetical protein
VILTEETDWIGGQLTAQESRHENPGSINGMLGCTRQLSSPADGIRDYYRRNYPLKPEIAAIPISTLVKATSARCAMNRVFRWLCCMMLKPYIASGRLTVPCAPSGQRRNGWAITSAR